MRARRPNGSLIPICRRLAFLSESADGRAVQKEERAIFHDFPTYPQYRQDVVRVTATFKRRLEIECGCARRQRCGCGHQPLKRCSRSSSRNSSWFLAVSCGITSLRRSKKGRRSNWRMAGGCKAACISMMPVTHLLSELPIPVRRDGAMQSGLRGSAPRWILRSGFRNRTCSFSVQMGGRFRTECAAAVLTAPAVGSVLGLARRSRGPRAPAFSRTG